jgi:hypothetical protein
VSFAGYGEMLLENFNSANESGAGGAPTTRLDLLRAVLYAGYRFTDKFLFNSEIEVEHGNEIFVEFAYVDYLINENLSLRGGLLLLPVGLVNEFHEPNVFLGAKRPETEQRIISSTWRENGAGLVASFGIVNLRAYLTNGMNGVGFTCRFKGRPPARCPSPGSEHGRLGARRRHARARGTCRGGALSRRVWAGTGRRGRPAARHGHDIAEVHSSPGDRDAYLMGTRAHLATPPRYNVRGLTACGARGLPRVG